ncbi:hypothetical protein N7925_25360 [Streptomyces sp. CA-278952]|uniref:hypothetical protein n=1 Tax=unclassified Streptomyces TaxID=2593676 RepID=UPI002241D79D|nr:MULTISPECIES: hypothetical protein [unclassified Streptomyces]UZI31374.1 hypothetical protein OH133_26565 [Streptomyces sp. VB1]WDG31416.1 hypothetical protein N7925_25360 [Streptomyces sp. CA-278952]
MTASAGEAHDGTGRWSVAGPVLTVLSAAAVGGFLTGAVLGEGERDLPQGLFLAAAFVLLGAGAFAATWWWNRRRAAKFGMSAGRYLRVGRLIRRGEAPDDPTERAAAVDIAARMRRALGSSSRRWVWWLVGAGALLWFVSGVFLVVDGSYGRASYNLVMAGLLLVNPLAMRGRRRRMKAAERALGTRPPSATPPSV